MVIVVAFFVFGFKVTFWDLLFYHPQTTQESQPSRHINVMMFVLRIVTHALAARGHLLSHCGRFWVWHVRNHSNTSPMSRWYGMQNICTMVENCRWLCHQIKCKYQRDRNIWRRMQYGVILFTGPSAQTNAMPCWDLWLDVWVLETWWRSPAHF